MAHPYFITMGSGTSRVYRRTPGGDYVPAGDFSPRMKGRTMQTQQEQAPAWFKDFVGRMVKLEKDLQEAGYKPPARRPRPEDVDLGFQVQNWYDPPEKGEDVDPTLGFKVGGLWDHLGKEG